MPGSDASRLRTTSRSRLDYFRYKLHEYDVPFEFHEQLERDFLLLDQEPTFQRFGLWRLIRKRCETSKLPTPKRGNSWHQLQFDKLYH